MPALLPEDSPGGCDSIARHTARTAGGNSLETAADEFSSELTANIQASPAAANGGEARSPVLELIGEMVAVPDRSASGKDIAELTAPSLLNQLPAPIIAGAVEVRSAESSPSSAPALETGNRQGYSGQAPAKAANHLGIELMAVSGNKRAETPPAGGTPEAHREPSSTSQHMFAPSRSGSDIINESSPASELAIPSSGPQAAQQPRISEQPLQSGQQDRIQPQHVSDNARIASLLRPPANEAGHQKEHIARSTGTQPIETAGIRTAEVQDQSGIQQRAAVAFAARLTQASLPKNRESIQSTIGREKPAQRTADAPTVSSTTTRASAGSPPVNPVGSETPLDPGEPVSGKFTGSEHTQPEQLKVFSGDSQTQSSDQAGAAPKSLLTNSGVPIVGNHVQDAAAGGSPPARQSGQAATPSGQSAVDLPELRQMVNTEASARIQNPAREINLRLGDIKDASVDVQVLEKSGKVHVAVRTPDTDLASSLRTNLDGLLTRVEHQGFRAETWTPLHGTLQPQAAHKDSWSGSTAQFGDSSQGGNGSGDHQSGDQRQQQHNRPAWLEELERSISGAQTPGGEVFEWTQLLRQ